MRIKIFLAAILAVFCFHGVFSLAQFSKAPKNSRDFSHEEINASFEMALDEWKAGQDYLAINDISMECEIDELLLKRDLNQKAYQNISLEIDIFHESVEMTKEAMDYADQVYGSLYDCFYSKSKYGKLVYQIKVNRYLGSADNGADAGSRLMLTGFIDDQNHVPQPKNELKAQTVAYEYAKEMRQKKYLKDSEEIPYGSPVLTRFGVDGTDELIVEFEMSTPHDENMEAFQESLDARGKELCDLLNANKHAVKYMEEHKITTITIRFVTVAEGDNFYYEYRQER